MDNEQQLLGQVSCVCIKRNGDKFNKENVLLKEHNLEIYVNKTRKLISLCTNDCIKELIVGRLFTEGLINTLEEISEISVLDGNNKAYVTINSCDNIPAKMLSSISYPDEWIFDMADKLEAGMPLYEKTHGIHSCFLYNNGKLLFACEDIGRHNAMDKAIGYALLNQIELSECSIYSSGRVPSDMIKKVIKAGIPIFVSKGIPTEDSIELAKMHRITLICGARRDKMSIYTDYRKKEIDALILAGGKSSRMGGKHKGNLMCENETFVQRLINEMTKVSDKIWLSYGNTVHAEYDKCRIVQDIHTDCGPIGGIHAGLSEAENEKAIIVACDMPFMRAEFFGNLMEQMDEETDIIVPVVDGRIHPLAAIYKKRILPVVESQIQSGNYRLRKILDQVNTKYIDVSDDARMVEMLRNINTVEEYQQIN